MNKIRKLAGNTILLSILLGVFGLVLIIFSAQIDSILKWAVFGFLVLICGGGLFTLLRNKKDENSLWEANSLAITLLSLAIAVYVAICWEKIVDFANFLFAIIILVSGLRKLQVSINMKAIGCKTWYIALILGVLCIGFGITVMYWQPDYVYILFGSLFLFAALTSLVADIWFAKLQKKSQTIAAESASAE